MGLGGRGGSLGDAFEVARDGSLTLHASYGKRSGAIIPSPVHIGPVLQQCLHDMYMTVPAGHAQRSGATIPSLVHVGPTLQQRLHHRYMTVPAGWPCTMQGASTAPYAMAHRE